MKRGIWDDFLSAYTVYYGTIIPKMRDIDLEKQFTFKGFIPLEEYKRYNPDKYCYIMANRLLDGKQYIYPAKFTNNYKLMRRGIPDIHQVFGLIALPGFTRIQYATKK